MPANNPLVGNRHVSSYSSSANSSRQEGAVLAAPALAAGAGAGYNVPLVVIVIFALAILLLLRVWGFRFVVSAGVAGH